MPTIDLNADLGEYQSASEKDREVKLLSIVSSCNIACGGHVGDLASIEETISAALQNHVAIGAHPSYPDKEGFGRRSMRLSQSALQESIQSQLLLFQRALENQQGTISHIKAHGALYNDMALDNSLCEVFLEVVAKVFPTVKIVGLPESALSNLCIEKGFGFIEEAFADRRYTDEKLLLPRSEKGAVLTTVEERVWQARAIALGEEITTHSGAKIIIPASTICVHGDDEEALKTAKAIRETLHSCGVEIRACQ